MNGELDFAAALNERVGLLKGLPVARLDEAAKRIRYMPGGATLVATMKQHGATCALVSGGFTYFTAMVKQALGFDFDAANVLKHDGSTLAGTVELPILGKEAKLATLDRLAAERGLQVGETITVGDGANDLPMLKAAGLGVAFHAKPVVAAEVAARIDHGDLTSLLYLQGYRLQRLHRKARPMTDATQIVLAKRPDGDVTADCFREEKVTLPALGRRPAPGTPALPVARSLHAAAHDGAALLHAALRARPAPDRRLGRRGGRIRATRSSPRATSSSAC